jgi:selenide,water dikinase
MRTLNRAAAETLSSLPNGPHAVTDVTGFGLFGHGWEMAERSGVALTFDGGRLPLYAGALEAAEARTRTGGDARNRAHLEDHVTCSATPALEALAYDPQTSGGLLAAVAPTDVPTLTSAGFTVIGEVIKSPPKVTLKG